MELLESFVASALLRRVRGADADYRLAACASFRGAALFVDISQYTALAETLCQQGADGVEQLGKTLDLAFRSHVSAVHSTSGEIACFAGDAFVAYWPADDDDIHRAVRQAQECAQRLHAAARSDASSSSVALPALHIGLSAGNLWAAHLGADERWQLLLAGPAVREACAASARAVPGETAVSPAVDALSAVSTAGANDRAGAPDLRAAGFALPAGDVTAHVPKRVQEYAVDGYSAWIPQRRIICALFVRIDGLDDAAPDALFRYQDVVTSLHTVLRPFTGSAGTLLLDDKGLVFTLCLGMPHDAHADDALRAVRAGLAVRAELARRKLGCSIGIASGPGVCMPLGGPPRRHYWAVGRFMHVAGRLMQAAGDGLLCTEDVADRVRRAVSLTPERPLALKGLRGPLRSFRVHEAAAIVEDHVLFGRADEQGALERCLAAYERGSGSVLWIVGEAGLGKTALVHYLRLVASQHQIACLSGGAASVDIAVAYQAWRPVFAALLADPAASDDSSLVQSGAELGAVRHKQFAPLINAVVPGALEETPLVQRLSGQARADATVSLLSGVIGSKATDRFVLVLEDCHWMDSASWRLVVRVAQDYPRALVVLTSRPAPDNQELEGLRRLPQFQEMKLAPLRAAAIRSIVEHVLAGSSVPPELIDETAGRAVGNPLFAREYALWRATDEARGTTEPGRAAAASKEPAAVPVTVQSLIASRLDALSPAEDLVLKTASVVGDTFGIELIVRVHRGSVGEESVRAALTNLAGRQLIVRAETGDAFAFQHALIREVTSTQLTKEQRRDVHRRVAEAIEEQCAADLRPYVAVLAHHWAHAEAPESTIKYAEQAASQALAAGAFEEADRLLSSCIRLAADDRARADVADRIRWHRQVADARHGMGQLESRSAAAHQVLRLAGRPRPHNTLALVAQGVSRLCGLGVRSLLPARREPEAAAGVLDIARAYRHSAEVCYFNNDMFGMICDNLSAVACASSVKPSAVLAGASAELGGILSIAGLRRTGEHILRHALAVAEAAGDQAAQAYAHMISCLYYVGIGDWQAAEQSARRCQELCEPMDDRVNWTNAQAVRFWMSHYRCHESAAYEAATRLRDRAAETGNRQHRAWAFRFLALCALRNGAAGDAILQLEAGLECLGETAALNERLPSLAILALAQLQNGEVWSARATAKDALAQVVRVRRPIGHSTLEGYSALVTVALDAWCEDRSPEWRRAITVCLRVLDRYSTSFPVGVPRYQLHLGDYRRRSGAVRAALRSYRRGEAAAARLGMPWEARRCREALAELAVDRDD